MQKQVKLLINEQSMCMSRLLLSVSHACSSCKSFITDAGDGSLLEAVSEDMLARLLPSPYYRSAQPIARSAFGALSRSLSPCDLCYMGPTGRGQPCKRKYVSSALRAVDLHLKSVLTAANGAYLLQHRWLPTQLSQKSQRHKA